MKKRSLLFGLLLLGIMGITGCSGSKITGEYIGEGSTLTIRGDKTWCYFYDGWMEDVEFNGTYESVDNNTYKLESDKIVLYADIEGDNRLYVYSDDRRWGEETFRKVGDN